MSAVRIWIVIAGMTAVTFLTRSGFLLLPERYALPPLLLRALRYAPACALVAIIVSDVLSRQSLGANPFDNPRLWGAAAGVLVFYRTRSMLVTIGAGMLVLTAVRFFPS